MPPLSEFIRSVPRSLVSDVPTAWLEALRAEDTDYLVLVDANEVPIRVLSLRHLLTLLEAGGLPMAPARNAELTEGRALFSSESDPDSDPSELAGDSGVTVDIVTVTRPLEVVAQMVVAAPDTCWIVVDQQQRYLGCLNKTRLLAAVFSQLLPEVQESKLVTSISPSESLIEEDIEIKNYTASQEQLSQSNTALLTYLGHELKTPLTSLLGLSSLLKTGRLGELNARQVRYIGLIQQHCRRLAAWVNTLIDLGRIESGTLQLIPVLVDLSGLWRAAYSQAALRVGHEELQTPSMPSQLQGKPPTVTLVADPPRLEQMLICLMQTALAKQATDSTLMKDTTEQADFPLKLEVWDGWVAFISQILDEDLHLDQFSRATFSLPFPTTSAASTPLSAEMGHWLEWLLVRKLAQLQGGELALMAHSPYGICPTLLLPTTPGFASPKDNRFLLFIAPAQGDYIATIQRQATQLNYRLLITFQIKDAVEIASHLPLSAIAMVVQGPQSVNELRYLKTTLAGAEPLVVALVTAQWSSLLGNLPADRELLWPTNSLGSVLLQPPSSVPPPSRLTVLYLKAPTPSDVSPPLPKHAAALKLPHIFHDVGCRVLEVDNLEQAELLQRVWHPDVAVLDPTIADPADYLQNFSQSPELTSLPLITLTMATTQATHRLPALNVFPCLVGETPWDTPEVSDRMAAWLIQVLQVAATHSA